MRRLVAAALGSLLLAGCQSLGGPVQTPTAELEGAHTLTLIVAELQMHLRDDVYRSFRARTANGRDVFQDALYRLDRLQSQRVAPDESWSNLDIVVEYARARALERSRRYSEAHTAYQRVAEAGSLLGAPAARATDVMGLFMKHSGPWPASQVSPAEEFDGLAERVAAWNELSWQLRGSPWEHAALEESEAWSAFRVDAVLRQRGVVPAIEASELMIERHRTSKLYPRHLLRLGDLYAEAARGEYLRSRVERAPLDARRYDGFLDHAISAYELAGEERSPVVSVEAAKKIEALLAAHRGVVADVR